MHLMTKLLGLTLCLFPTTLWSFDCDAGTDELIKTLPGTWVVSNDTGTLTIGNRTMTLPPANGSVGEISRQGDGLAALDWGIPGLFPIEIVTDARFILDPTRTRIVADGEIFNNALPEFISGDEVRLLAGCNEGKISPQLSISGTFQDEEGPVDFEVFLFAINKNTLYGVTSGRLKSLGGHAKRISRWTRAGER